MSFKKNSLLIAAVIGACVVTGPAMAQDSTATAAPELPSSVDMTLGVQNTEFQMPEGFRGKEATEGDLQWLEDVGILMAENSDLYNVDAAAIAEAAKFTSEPNINWEISKEDDDGNLVAESSDNTNKATNNSNIKDPGYYQVHNGGARQVGTAEGAEGEEVAEGSSTTTTGTGGSGSTTTTTGTEGTEGGEGAGDSQTVTAQQRMGIQVHDCTAPDIWVAFQEGAGNVNMAETEEALRTQMLTKILENMGQPFSNNEKDFEDASYIFVDEGKDEDRDRIPWEKTARLSIAGTLFNERGAPKVESGTLTAKMDQKEYRNAVNVIGGEEKNLKGVYVRRNVPFIFAAIAADNGNKRKSAVEVEARIEKADGTEVEKDGDGYLFRIPNFPRDKYQEQPEYTFIATCIDKDGNSTNIRMPLYIVDTQTAFEGGKNQ